MPKAAQRREFAPKKLPSQARSRETFEALVEACARLLRERGFAAVTTNHVAERAGVSIASLYEYFPDKDAIVAQVAERLVERVLARIAAGVPRVMAAGEDEAIRLWIALIHDTVAKERELVAVFQREVPYTNRLAAVQAIGEQLLALSRGVRERAGGFVRADFTDATLHLAINLVVSTILQCVQGPPRDVSRRALLDELAVRIEEWIRAPAARR